jgi:hypothetical protein
MFIPDLLLDVAHAMPTHIVASEHASLRIAVMCKPSEASGQGTVALVNYFCAPLSQPLIDVADLSNSPLAVPKGAPMCRNQTLCNAF